MTRSSNSPSRAVPAISSQCVDCSSILSNYLNLSACDISASAEIGVSFPVSWRKGPASDASSELREHSGELERRICGRGMPRVGLKLILPLALLAASAISPLRAQVFGYG